MSYYRKKYRWINGKRYGPYWYKVRSVRHGRKVRQIIEEYLGKDGPVQKENIKEELQEPESNVTRALRLFTKIKHWIVFDFETTGFGKQDKIIEIAFQRFSMKNGKLEEGNKLHSLVDPQKQIPRLITELTGITNNDVSGKPTIDELIGDTQEFIQNEHLIAHNAKFDKRFLDREFNEAGFNLVPDKRIVDTLDMSRKIYGTSMRHNLNVCVDRERVETKKQYHSADFDVLMTARIFVSMCKKLKKQGK